MPLDTSEYGQHVAQTLTAGLQIGARIAQMRTEASLALRQQTLREKAMDVEMQQLPLQRQYQEARIAEIKQRVAETGLQLQLLKKNADRQALWSKKRADYPELETAEMAAATKAMNEGRPYAPGGIFARYASGNPETASDPEFVAAHERANKSITALFNQNMQYQRNLTEYEKAISSVQRLREQADRAFEAGDRVMSNQINARADALATAIASGNLSGEEVIPAGTVRNIQGQNYLWTGSSFQPMADRAQIQRDSLLETFQRSVIPTRSGIAATLVGTMRQNPDIPLVVLNFLSDLSPAQAANPEFLRTFAAEKMGEAAPVNSTATGAPTKRWQVVQ